MLYFQWENLQPQRMKDNHKWSNNVKENKDITQNDDDDD